MKLQVIKYPLRIKVEDTTYIDGKLDKRKAWEEFTKRFVVPMRAKLRESLKKYKKLGAESLLEIGPGSGDGVDIGLEVGLSKIAMIERNPRNVQYLLEKYRKERREGEVTIHEGDVREVLPRIPSKSLEIGLIFDNTLSNMQEANAMLNEVQEDFRQFVLGELLRISREVVLVGVTSTTLTEVYTQLFEGEMVWTDKNGKRNIFCNGGVTQRYEVEEIRDLLLSTRPRKLHLETVGDIHWAELAP